MSGTPSLRCATPDSCSNSWASGTRKSLIENLDPQAWACRAELLWVCSCYRLVRNFWTPANGIQCSRDESPPGMECW
jgi:hypothetical protein